MLYVWWFSGQGQEAECCWPVGDWVAWWPRQLSSLLIVGYNDRGRIIIKALELATEYNYNVYENKVQVNVKVYADLLDRDMIFFRLGLWMGVQFSSS